MSETLDAADVTAAALSICRMIEDHVAEFNQLDANTGDGDMGTTLAVVAKAVAAEAVTPVPDLGEAFGRFARAVARTSGSSLAAIAMTGMMSLSKSLVGKSSATLAEFVASLDLAVATMRLRSRAQIGDKTVLDSLGAVVTAAAAVSTLEEFGPVAVAATRSVLAEFRNKPAQIGRSRLAENKGIGVDDPGMVFMSKAVAAVAGAARQE